MFGSELRKQVQSEEIDYLMLKSLLQHYARPRDKLRQYLRKQVLIRVKKGLYVFGPQFAQTTYSKEVLANLIYGPSALSLLYALNFYGMIPENVNEMTSITNKRNKMFLTSIGSFSYRYLHPSKYAVGITQLAVDKLHHILIATPEKALADQLILAAPKNLDHLKNFEQYLYDDLRINEKMIRNFKPTLLNEIVKIYHHPNTTLLLEHFKKLRRK